MVEPTSDAFCKNARPWMLVPRTLPVATLLIEGAVWLRGGGSVTGTPSSAASSATSSASGRCSTPRRRPRRRRSSIDRFLQLTEPAAVSLCLDTGHVAYAGGDNRALVTKHADRIGYIHLKSVDPTVIARVREAGMSFASAVQHGAMVEPPAGEPYMPPLLADLDALDVPLWAIVEHDMYPAPPGVPLSIATRTCRYYKGQGLS